VIGYTNEQGTSPSFDEMSHAASAAVSFINGHLGGVDGHPLKLDTCIMQTVEDGQKCAGQLLGAHVDVGDQGVVIVGNAPYFNTVNGKYPIIISGEGSTADSTTKHVYLTNGSGAVYVAHMADIAKSLGAKSVAVVSSSNPAGKYGASLMIGEMKKLGLTYKVVYEADTGTTPDYASALQAAGASSADMVALIPASVTGCISTFDAMKQLAINKKVVTTYTCYGNPFPQQAGSALSNWYFSGYTTNPHIVSDPQVQAWQNVMTAYGQAQWEYTGNAPQELQDLLLITRFANEIGFAKVTPAAMEAKLLAYSGPGFMIPGTIHCGAHPAPQIGVCGNESAASTFKNGQFVPYTG
jgi:branched-chain amino acid transport system substrate-binding protein